MWMKLASMEGGVGPGARPGSPRRSTAAPGRQRGEAGDRRTWGQWSLGRRPRWAPPESGPAGAVEASRTRRTGATRPKTGGSTVCGGTMSE